MPRQKRKQQQQEQEEEKDIRAQNELKIHQLHQMVGVAHDLHTIKYKLEVLWAKKEPVPPDLAEQMTSVLADTDHLKSMYDYAKTHTQQLVASYKKQRVRFDMAATLGQKQLIEELLAAERERTVVLLKECLPLCAPL